MRIAGDWPAAGVANQASPSHGNRELELRPKKYAKGSVGFVRPNDSWLEDLERQATVEVMPWGGEGTPAAARSAEEAAHAMRRLQTRATAGGVGG